MQVPLSKTLCVRLLELILWYITNRGVSFICTELFFFGNQKYRFILLSGVCLSPDSIWSESRSEWEKKFCPFLAEMSHFHVVEINCFQTSPSFLVWNPILILFWGNLKIINFFLICFLYYLVIIYKCDWIWKIIIL